MNRKYHLLSWLAAIIITIGLMPVRTGAESSLPYLELTRPDRGKVFAVAWSPDGQYVAVGTEQGLWLYTDTLADVLHVADQPIHALAWSPDGRMIATGYFGKRADTTVRQSNRSYLPTRPIQGGGIRLWSVKKGEQGFALAPQATLLRDGSVYALRFNPDGSRLASLSQELYLEYSDDEGAQDVLRIYGVESGKLLYQFDSETPLLQDETIAEGANGLAWSHDGRYLATVRPFDKVVWPGLTIWDTAREQFTKPPGGLQGGWTGAGEMIAVDWSDGDARLALSGVQTIEPNTDGGITVGYWGEMEQFVVLPGPPLFSRNTNALNQDNVSALAWRPGRQWLAYTDRTAIRLWDGETKQPIAVLDAAYEAVTILAWNTDGSKLLAAGSDYAVRIWTRFDSYQSPDPQPTRETRLAVGRSEGVLSPDGQWMAKADETSGHVEVINVVSGSIHLSIDLHLGQSPDSIMREAIQWSPDGTMLAIPIMGVSGSCSGWSQETVQIWQVHTGDRIRTWENISSFAWRPDSQAMAVGGLYFEVRDIQTGQIIEGTPPDEQWEAKLAALQNLASDDHIYSVSHWSPDGRLLAFDDYVVCGMYDNTSIILWDTQRHAIAARLETWRSSWGGSGGTAAVVAWSPDGNTVAVQGFDHFYLYRLYWQGDTLTPKLLWQRSNRDPLYRTRSSTSFSPDGRYFLIGDTVWDTVSGWPVFRFRAPMNYDTYRWVGDTLTGYDFGFAGNNIPGKVVSWRASDFLPQTGR